MNHPTQQELIEHAARAPGAPPDEGIVRHLDGCERCREALLGLASVDSALRSLPAEAPSAGFTQKVLSRIGVREATPLWWLFARNFAPVLAAGVVAIVVMALGAGGTGGGEPSVGRSLFDAGLVREGVRGAIEAFSVWVGSLAARHLSFGIGKDALSVGILLACLFALIGLVDRFVIQPMVRRRQEGRSVAG